MPYVGNMNTTFTTLTSSDANITDDLTVTDDASIGGTLGVTGVVTANAGVVVDNITIDGTEIDLSSGDLTLDVASDIILDSDAANWRFKDAGTSILEIGSGGTGGGPSLYSAISDADMVFKGNDGGSAITALTLDMSEAGAATFNNNVTAFSDKRLKFDIETFKNGLEKVEQLRGVTYKRNDFNGNEQLGVIAQEVEEVLPQVVLTAKDDMRTKSVDYGRLTAVLIEAVKELSTKVKDLEEK